MTGQPLPQEVCDEMCALVAASLRRDISVEQRSRLEELVCLDINACDLYLNLVFESDALIAWAKGSETQLGRPPCDSQHDKVVHSESSGDDPHEAELPAMPVLFDNAGSETLGSVFSGWPVAYLAATVIFAIGLVVGAFTYVSHPGNSVVSGQWPVVSKSNSQSLIPNPSPKAPSVGRITGVADCRWADPHFKATLDDNVPLGRKYALSSGLMEITYDTGAKVILQGPITYEVESGAGGYLSVGKLAAKLEKKAEASSLSPLPSPLSPLFSVRTPTAVVTDLGTEFGVDVNRKGLTKTQVFVGTVRVQGRSPMVQGVDRVLHTGQVLRMDSQASVVHVSEDGEDFVRTMPAAKATASPDLIGQIDYSETWTCNSPTRAGSNLPLIDPDALRVESCRGNPPRSWVVSDPIFVTTSPSDNTPVPWPGHHVRGSKSGFTESRWGECYFGLEYGLRDDFVVQFDAVQTSDRVNITISDSVATFGGPKSLSVFFRAAATGYPEIGLYAQGSEFNTGLRSGIATPWQWHNYAVQFNLRKKKLTVWVDRRSLGTVDLAAVTLGMTNGSWADLPLTNRFVNVGGHARNDGGPNRAEAGCVWTDNFRVGSPAKNKDSP